MSPHRARVIAGQLAIGVVLLSVWEMADRSGRYGIWISSPTRVGQQLTAWLLSGEMWPHLWASLEVLAAGYVIGGLVGIGTGLALGLSWHAGRAWDPLIRGVNAVPRFALAPLFIIWLGTDMTPKVALVSAAVGYIVLSTTLDGVRRVDGELLTAVRLMGARRLQVVRMVILPSALSAILLGLRLAIPYGLVATIAADMLVGAQGLGFMISRASGYLDIDQLFAAITIVLAIGVALSTLLGRRQQALATSGEVAGTSW